MALTQECVLSFLLERGGKVKNAELLNYFRSHISRGDPAEKQHNRDLFKKLVNSVAVVKQIDEVKFVVVKKRYQDFVREAAHDAPRKTQMDDSASSHNSSFSYSSPRRGDSAGVIYSDAENNNVCHPSNMHDKSYSGAKRTSAGTEQGGGVLTRSASGADTATVKVLNISGDQTSRTRKSGAVFAVIAVKSPPRDPAPAAQGASHHHARQEAAPNTPVTLITKVSPPSLPNLNSPSRVKEAFTGAQWKNRPAEDSQQAGFPQVRPPKQDHKTSKQGDDAKYSESVPLEPLAHEWLVKCAAGLWGQIYGLLLQDTRLAQKKDFMSGFTALHWAAKDGNGEMIIKLMDTSSKTGTCINVNSKAHGGYTPLHIAALHGHADVMALLVRSYGASVNERDNDGKKAFHYLGEGVPDQVRALLGGLQQMEKTADEDYREHSKGFNTISKLFQPHIGRRQKASTKPAHDW